MAKIRDNIVATVVGGRGTGKSTFIRQKLVNPYPKKVLIYDINVNRKFSDIEEIPIQALEEWNSNTKATYKNRIVNSDFKMCLKEFLKLKNCLLVLEDTTKYVGSVLPKDVKTLMLETKQTNVDLILTFHSYRRMPPDVFDFSNMLEVFATNDNDISDFEGKISEFPSVWVAWKKALAEHKKGNPYYHSTVIID